MIEFKPDSWYYVNHESKLIFYQPFDDDEPTPAFIRNLGSRFWGCWIGYEGFALAESPDLTEGYEIALVMSRELYMKLTTLPAFVNRSASL